MKLNSFAGFAWAVLLLTACSTLVHRTGELVEGEYWRHTRIATYTNSSLRVDSMRMRSSGEEYLVITPTSFPTLRFNATMPDSQGNIYIHSMNFLCSNRSGWNEFTQEAYSVGVFLPIEGNGESARMLVSIREPLELMDIQSGRIRRNSTRIAEGEALTALRNRYERIHALSQWMNSQATGQDRASLKEFKNYWEPILFPELVAKKKRPPEWTVDGAEWSRGEDVRWNRSYTQALLPEDLQPVRNSGTLLRDWEEALDWIYVQCQWETISRLMEEQQYLSKTK